MLEISIDWLQFTSKDSNHLTSIIEVLRLDVKMFTELKKGKLGYKKQLFYNDIYVLYDGNKDMGTHIILSGKGCKQYETHHSILSLLKIINEKEMKCTRIDLAIDDFEGDIIPLEKLIDDISRGNTVSKWKTSIEFIKRDLATGEKIGQTINVGSRKSEVFLRVYNKSQEQKIEGSWTRMELEIKGQKAQKLQSIINESNVGSLSKSIINNYIRIVQPSDDSNKSRWPTRPYWQRIIDTTEKTTLTQPKQEKTLEDLENWIEKQVAPSLATIVMAKGGDVDFLYEQIAKGKKRMNTKHLSLVEKEMAEECLIELL